VTITRSEIAFCKSVDPVAPSAKPFPSEQTNFVGGAISDTASLGGVCVSVLVVEGVPDSPVVMWQLNSNDPPDPIENLVDADHVTSLLCAGTSARAE
jgi:hypothetical protein